MSIALRKPNRVLEREYLQFENSSALRHELVGGVSCGMLGGSDRHDLICGNLFAEIRAGVPPPWQVFSAQMKLEDTLALESVKLQLHVRGILRDIPF